MIYRKRLSICCHDILFNKLQKIGIRGQELMWFKSYLGNRKQFVSIGDCKSESRVISKGVPQGSILGPILFLIYINDLEKSTTLLSLLFADDTSFLIRGSNLNELVSVSKCRATQNLHMFSCQQTFPSFKKKQIYDFYS